DPHATAGARTTAAPSLPPRQPRSSRRASSTPWSAAGRSRAARAPSPAGAASGRCPLPLQLAFGPFEVLLDGLFRPLGGRGSRERLPSDQYADTGPRLSES